jgi:DNA-binding NarL/FixJ family response regulator
VCEAADGLDAVRLGESQAFDLLLVDLRLPVLDGYSAAGQICRSSVGRGLGPPAVILIVDAVHELPASPSVPGAELRVLFRDSPVELVQSALGWAVDRAEERGGAVRFEPNGDAVAESADAADDGRWVGLLSARERQVLVSLCHGQSNRQLAQALSVSEATVKTHVSHLLAKLRVASRVEAVVFAYENGIVVPGRRRSA